VSSFYYKRFQLTNVNFAQLCEISHNPVGIVEEIYNSTTTVIVGAGMGGHGTGVELLLGAVSEAGRWNGICGAPGVAAQRREQ